MKAPIWYPSDEVDAQMAHLGWGAFISFAGSTIWGPGVGAAMLLAWATLKEFAFDIVIEEDTWLDSLFDWSMYLVGGAIGYSFFFGQIWL